MLTVLKCFLERPDSLLNKNHILAIIPSRGEHNSTGPIWSVVAGAPMCVPVSPCLCVCVSGTVTLHSAGCRGNSADRGHSSHTQGSWLPVSPSSPTLFSWPSAGKIDIYNKQAPFLYSLSDRHCAHQLLDFLPLPCKKELSRETELRMKRRLQDYTTREY